MMRIDTYFDPLAAGCQCQLCQAVRRHRRSLPPHVQENSYGLRDTPNDEVFTMVPGSEQGQG